jgi:hypothetical protein
MIMSFIGHTINHGQTIPFQLAGKLIIVQAEIDDRPVNLILDTGTDHLILNSKYYRGMRTEKKYYGINGQAEQIQTKFTKLKLNELKWTSVYSEILSLEHLENARGIEIHGVIGNSLLRKHEILIDYANLQIRIIELDRKGERIRQAEYKQPLMVYPFSMKGSTPVIEVSLDQQFVRFGVDSGAEINLLDKTIMDKNPAQIKQLGQRTIGGFSKSIQTKSLYVTTGLEIGETICQPMRTMLSDLSHMNASRLGSQIDGILGYEFLSQFVVSFNYRKRELSISKASKSLDNIAMEDSGLNSIMK